MKKTREGEKERKRWIDSYPIAHDFSKLARVAEGKTSDLGALAVIGFKDAGDILLVGRWHVNEEVAEMHAF